MLQANAEKQTERQNSNVMVESQKQLSKNYNSSKRFVQYTEDATIVGLSTEEEEIWLEQSGQGISENNVRNFIEKNNYEV